MNDVIDKEKVWTARDALHNKDNGDAFERLTLALCILLDGVLERALEEWEDDDT